MCQQKIYPIRTEKDIETFLEQSNGLHDGYVLDVHYQQKGIRRLNDRALEVCPQENEVTIRVLITSIWDSVMELHFKGVSEWQVQDCLREINDTSVFLQDDGQIVWTDGYSADASVRKQFNYVVAESMEYSFCEDHRR